MNRSQRKSFFTLQAHFNNEKEPLLNAGSYKESSPISYIIIGIAVSLIILFLVNRFRRFREYFLRSLFRPYNFYADIRDQRIISTVQSFLLAIVIAFTLGIFFSSLFYFFKSSETAQYFYKIFIPGSLCQEIFYKMVWMPEMMMITVSIISFISILVIAAILRGFSIFVSNRIFFKDTFIITVWAGTPFIILLPLSIILYRVLFIMPDILWISVAVLVLLAFWIIYRILRAVAVVFDVIESRIYLAGTAFIVLVKLIMITIYQINFSVFAYLKFFLHNLLN
jgi:beta-galactosidase